MIKMMGVVMMMRVEKLTQGDRLLSEKPATGSERQTQQSQKEEVRL
jgi:hypothetical protein